MSYKTVFLLTAMAIFVGIGLFITVVQGIEPLVGPCTKYSLVCVR
jgi:hypothetical protein